MGSISCLIYDSTSAYNKHSERNKMRPFCCRSMESPATVL